MNEDKAARFHRLRRRAALAAAGWSVLLLVLLVVTGGSRYLSDFIVSYVYDPGLPESLFVAYIALLYAIVVALAHELVAFPLAYFTGFVLERRYGLSRQSASDWCRDHVKALGLGLLFAGLSAGFVYLAIARWPGSWWLMATAGAVAVSVVLTWLAPVVLTPLFFTLAPLKNESLRDRLTALARRTGAGPMDVYEWRLSTKTSRANAALIGFGRTRRILLSDTLISDYSEDEIEVILAHELSHQVSHDIWWALALEAVVVATGFWAGSIALRWLIQWAGLAGVSDPAGSPILVLSAMSVSAMALPLLNGVSRWRERSADRFALDTTRNAAAFASAMKRLGASNLAEEDPPLFARVFFHTHPPLGDRLEFARSWAARLGVRSKSQHHGS